MKDSSLRVSEATDTDRYLTPDLLRGLAILLLLLTNVPLILTTIRYDQVVGISPFTGNLLDDSAIIVFLSIPTMTGMGMFVLAMGQSLARAGDTPADYRLALSRLFVIGVIGLVHGLLIWWGDILVYYLVAGLIALYFRQRPPSAQFVIGISFTMIPVLLTVSDLIARVGGVRAEVLEALNRAALSYEELRREAIDSYTSFDFLAVPYQRVRDWLGYAQDFALIGGIQLVGLLLVGIALARIRAADSRLLNGARAGVALRAVSLLAITGYLVQLFTQILLPEDVGILSAIASCCQIVAPPLLAITIYVAILRSEQQLGKFAPVRWLAMAGRYSLSIYILTSIICAVLAYGMGLYAQFSVGVAVLLSLGLYLVLIVVFGEFSRRNRLGPLEWLVRVAARDRGRDQR